MIIVKPHFFPLTLKKQKRDRDHISTCHNEIEMLTVSCVAQTTQNIWNFVVVKIESHKKWPTFLGDYPEHFRPW